MNIFFTIDNNFVPQLLVAICSICENNRKADEIVFYVAGLGLSEKEEQIISDYILSYDRKFEFVDLDVALDDTFEIDTGGWNKVVLARLLMGRLLPESVERVLYLDADTIVNESLEQLWHTDLLGKVLAGTIEPTADRKRLTRLGIGDKPYINAGVLLVDLNLWRKYDLENQIITFVNSHAEDLFANDQDAINILLKNDIYYLSPNYNYCNSFYLYDYKTLKKMMKDAPYLSYEEFQDAVSHPSIIHFLGEDRPWRAGSTHRYKALYEHYLELTPYSSIDKETGWEAYFKAWSLFNTLMSQTPFLRYRLITNLIPMFMGIKKKKRLMEDSNLHPGDNFLSAANHTFVICAYGESQYLEECLLSLSIQTIPSRIIIATSTPNEMIDDLARKFDVPIYINYGESGIAGDWNFALSCAETPLVTIAHQDDVYSDYYVEWMLESLNQVDKPLLYFTNYGEIRNGEYVNDSAMNDVKRLLLKPLEIQSMQKVQVMKRGVISLGNSICCPSVTYCMDALPKPVFSSGMKSNLDWEAWERLSRLEGEFVYDSRIGMYHRIHKDSETSACIIDDTRTKEDLMMLKKFWPDPIANLINKAYTKAQQYN